MNNGLMIALATIAATAEQRSDEKMRVAKRRIYSKHQPEPRKAFKSRNIIGVSPAEYRRKHLGEKPA